MAELSELTEQELKRKIDGAKLVIERNEGLIKEAAQKKLVKLEAELEKRGDSAKKEVKEVKADVKADAEATVKEVKEEAKKVEKKAEEKEEPKKKAAKKKATNKKATPKAVEPKEKKTPAPSSEKFALTIDGEEYVFADLKSKESCAKAVEAVKARRAEQIKNKEAAAEGRERAKTISVTKRITENFASIAKKAVAEVPKIKIDKHPTDIKNELAEVEKAFNNLFDKLGELMGKEIPPSQRKEIMDILTKFEQKVGKGTDKKEVAASQTRKKEDGGLASSEIDNSWSYASLM